MARQESTGNKYQSAYNAYPTNQSAKPFRNDVTLQVQPQLDFPTPIVENVMFFVEREVKEGSSQLNKTWKLGQKFTPSGKLNVLPYMKEAVLTHIMASPTAQQQNVYRFFYVVPYKEQHRYNMKVVRKDQDGYFYEDGTLAPDGKVAPIPKPSSGVYVKPSKFTFDYAGNPVAGTLKKLSIYGTGKSFRLEAPLHGGSMYVNWAFESTPTASLQNNVLYKLDNVEGQTKLVVSGITVVSAPITEEYKFKIYSDDAGTELIDTVSITIERVALTRDARPEPVAGKEYKSYYQIQREFVIRRDEGYEPPRIGDYDPSNTENDPEYKLDAQLVHEETRDFEEEYLKKIFVKVVRLYWTVPGPLVKGFYDYPFFIRGDTVWVNGGPGTSSNPWEAVAGDFWTRIVWGAPAPGNIPPMPVEAVEANPQIMGFDKADFPALQTFKISKMYQRYSNVTLNNEQLVKGENCCDPPREFIKCERTTTSNTSIVDWDSDTPLPPLPDPPTDEAGEVCNKWQISSEIVNREGYSVVEQKSVCTSYEIVETTYASKFDHMTGKVTPITRTLVDRPTGPVQGQIDANGVYTTLQPVNGCYAISQQETCIGAGFTASWYETVNFSFPKVLANLVINVFPTVALANGRASAVYGVDYDYNPEGYSGPCRCMVEQRFVLSGNPFPVDTTKLGFVTKGFHWGTPWFGISISNSLHGAGTVSHVIPQADGRWAPQSVLLTYGQTIDRVWRNVETVKGTPMNGGILWEKRTIYPPPY